MENNVFGGLVQFPLYEIRWNRRKLKVSFLKHIECNT